MSYIFVGRKKLTIEKKKKKHICGNVWTDAVSENLILFFCHRYKKLRSFIFFKLNFGDIIFRYTFFFFVFFLFVFFKKPSWIEAGEKDRH